MHRERSILYTNPQNLQRMVIQTSSKFAAPSIHQDVGSVTEPCYASPTVNVDDGQRASRSSSYLTLRWSAETPGICSSPLVRSLLCSCDFSQAAEPNYLASSHSAGLPTSQKKGIRSSRQTQRTQSTERRRPTILYRALIMREAISRLNFKPSKDLSNLCLTSINQSQLRQLFYILTPLYRSGSIITCDVPTWS